MAISLTSPSLFSQVCNCNKYLKVSRERMKQLVESSRQVSGEHSAGEWVGDPPPVPFPGTHCSGQSRTILLGLGVSQREMRVPCHQPATGCRCTELFQVWFKSLPWLPCPALQGTGSCMGLPSRGSWWHANSSSSDSLRPPSPESEKLSLGGEMPPGWGCSQCLPHLPSAS